MAIKLDELPSFKFKKVTEDEYLVLRGKKETHWRRYAIRNCSWCNTRALFLKYDLKRYSTRFCCSRCHANYHRTGRKSINWRNGINVDAGGYITIVCHEHPNNRKNGIKAHRLVKENQLGRLLSPDEVIHHIDNVKYNNDEENLVLLPQGENAKMTEKQLDLIAPLLALGLCSFNQATLEYDLAPELIDKVLSMKPRPLLSEGFLNKYGIKLSDEDMIAPLKEIYEKFVEKYHIKTGTSEQ